MPVTLVSESSLGLSGLLFTGRVSERDALGFPAKIPTDGPLVSLKWINVFDSLADLSDLTADVLFRVRERLRPVVAALARHGPVEVVLVSNSALNDVFMEVWRAMVSLDADYPSKPRGASSIFEACQLHALSAEQAEQARVWLETELQAARNLGSS